MKRIVVVTAIMVAVLILTADACSHRQNSPSLIDRTGTSEQVSGLPHLWDLEPDDYLNGYATTLIGDPFTYHSPHPDAGTSLLSRATNHIMEIAWETASVPDDFNAPSAVFIWMCGIQRGPETHWFHLSIDGREAFTFTTILDGTPEEWEIGNDKDARLGFRSVMYDR